MRRFGESRRGQVRWVVALALAAGAGWAWRSQLFTVSRPGDQPHPLVLGSREPLREAGFDVILPAVPIGVERLRPGARAMLIHYWAPWERHGARQIVALDSLARSLDPERIRVVVVCFDPFPSVARFIARNGVRSRVLLDGRYQLRHSLPCPSVPFTYALDAQGRVRVAQPGEIDWLAPRTRATLIEIGRVPAVRDSAIVMAHLHRRCNSRAPG